MITKKKLETLKVIFSDCDLIDVAFSRWHSLVSIYLVADHLPLPTPGKRALVALRFRGVRKFEWEFRHHDVTGIPMKSEPDDHLQWNIYKSQFTAAQPLTSCPCSSTSSLYRAIQESIGTTGDSKLPTPSEPSPPAPKK